MKFLNKKSGLKKISGFCSIITLMSLVGCDLTSDNRLDVGHLNDSEKGFSWEKIYQQKKVYSRDIVSSENLKSLEDITTRDYQLTDVEIKLKYERAVEAYNWFSLTTIPVDENDYIIVPYYKSIDDTMLRIDLWYFRVSYKDIHTLNQFQTYLEGIFIPEFVEQLFSDYTRFRDVEGILYALGASGPHKSIVGYEDHEILRVDDITIVYRVIADILEIPWDFDSAIGTIEHDFTLRLVNGRWLFENFHRVR